MGDRIDAPLYSKIGETIAADALQGTSVRKMCTTMFRYSHYLSPLSLQRGFAEDIEMQDQQIGGWMGELGF